VERKLIAVPTTTNRPLPSVVATAPGVRRLATYQSMHSLAIPATVFDNVAARLTAAGFEIVELSDVIYTPRAAIHTADRHLPALGSAPGVFLLQYAAPRRRSGSVK
jgi:hypothetical protein